MGIAPYKTFTFDGESSADYDVYLTGVGVFDSPERDVEMIEILGRNGNFALDRGRFRNVSVKYKIGMYDLNEANFATKVSAFRNWLCSKVGYVRLSDDYNPNEYRMAVYASGFEFKHEFLIAGEAEITFDCKPQRWLTSGETATAVTSGGTLTNPTLFDSEPLLSVKGYGKIQFNGYEVDIQDAYWGDVDFFSPKTVPLQNQTLHGEGNLFWANTVGSAKRNRANTGDVITCEGDIVFYVDFDDGGYDIESESADVTLEYISTNASLQTLQATFTATPTNTCVLGTNGNFFQYTRRLFVKQSGTTIQTVTMTFTGRYSYTTESFWLEVSIDHYDNISFYDTDLSTSRCDITGSYVVDSTKSYLGKEIYLDCDLGMCYMNDSGIIDLNKFIDLGIELPKLPTGTTTITYDNTITSLKITPRWWQV